MLTSFYVVVLETRDVFQIYCSIKKMSMDHIVWIFDMVRLNVTWHLYDGVRETRMNVIISSVYVVCYFIIMYKAFFIFIQILQLHLSISVLGFMLRW